MIQNTSPSDDGINKLFPVFFKLEQLRVLLIGGGNVALEKLQAIINNAPATKIRVVAREVFDAFKQEANKYSTIEIITGEYESHYIDECDLIIAAVNDIPTSERIRNDAKQKGKLINAADKPSLCDFYLGSVITKGDIKIAISTNGKSPTLAKRLKEFFNEVLPDEIETAVTNLNTIRNNIQSGFKERVKKLNELTASLIRC